MAKWFRRVLALLLLLVLVAAAVLWIYAQRALPVTRGELVLTGAAAEVRIERDDNGIPTIRASSMNDAAFGLGVAHAQDRLWQMETQRRIGAGRLAEAFGEGALNADRFLRALGVRRAAAAQWARLAPDSRALLEAYTKGVNAVLHESMRARPPEFVVLGVQPEDWDPVDSLTWVTMMAWDLGGNWQGELLRLRLSQKMPVDRIEQLLPPAPGDTRPTPPDYAAMYRDLKIGPASTRQAWLDLLDVAPPSGVEGVGSNNWVLGGSKTASGKPLLANDPHLKLGAPALWYFARLEIPGLKVAGATLPGLPVVVLGQNDNIAWGFTNTGPDVQDLYIEELKADDPTMVRTPEGWAKLETIDEVIKVKGQPDVAIQVRRSRHGPVISDAGAAGGADLLKAGDRATHVLAMRWTALDGDTDPIQVSARFQAAKSVDEFIAASDGFVAPMQSMVVADRAGHIGMVAPGRVPLRRPDNELRGFVPAPGWDAKYDWIGWVPANETPREVDPQRGWIATANQRIVPDAYPHYLTSEWTLPYRYRRIQELIESRQKHSLDDLRSIQADVKSLEAAAMLPWLNRAPSQHPLAAAAREQLAGFDGVMAMDAAAPLIYWAWSRHLAELVFGDDLGAVVTERSTGGRTFRDALVGVLARNDASWCNDTRTPEAETCEQQSGRALTLALDELQTAHGTQVSTWQWGRAHIARSEHRPFSRVKALARFFELRVPTPGDTYTVNVSRVNLKPDPTTGELYLNEHGPSLRAMYDLDDLTKSRVIHSSGQSGILFSPHYRSFVDRWAAVKDVPLWSTEASKNIVVIQPKAAAN